MRNIGLFAEDWGHEAFLTALLSRLAREYGCEVAIIPRSVRGGYGQVITELREYVRDLRRARADWLDLLVVVTDANCKGFLQRKKEIDQIVGDLSIQIAHAIPDPHIERWMLVDSAAFKQVLGKGCQSPDLKCERDRYKRLLIEAVRNAGISPLLGGMEYVEDIVNALNLYQVEQRDESLGKLLKELHDEFNAWSMA